MTCGVTVKWDKVCVKEKGSAFPVDDFLQGAGGEAGGGTLPLQQWLYIPPPLLVCWYNLNWLQAHLRTTRSYPFSISIS